jgi:hypothetical protein
MPSVIKRLLAALAGLALTVSFLPAPASALPAMRSVEATRWGNLMAGSLQESPVDRPLPQATDPKSTFVVRYSLNFPPAARTAFDKALSIAAANFESPVPIVVDATWARLSPGVLGSARPTRFFTNFPGAPTSDLWYTSALANSISGNDLDPIGSDLTANFSSSAPWSFSTDGTAYRGYYDFVTVVLHEVVHGLGFLSNTYLSDGGVATIAQPTPFDAYVKVTNGEKRLADMQSGSIELANALVSPLEWIGPKGVAANGNVKPVMYSPARYEGGSSTSHLDEQIFNVTRDTLMTPRLDAAEVIYEIGPVTKAIFEDMRGVPPAPAVTITPSVPRNALALTGDRSAVVSFDPPINSRNSQVESYTVEVVGSTLPAVTGPSSPITVTGLEPGRSYVFQVTAKNKVGVSPPAFTNSIRVSATWRSNSVDPTANGSNVAQATWRGQSVLVYGDSTTGRLKMARWSGKKWLVTTVDGVATSNGRTINNVSGKVSTCVSGTGASQLLHIFYSDLTDRDLRYSLYDGKKFSYSVVDGNAAFGQEPEDRNRARTNSDVSVSNACAATSAGVQVFYRDETLGILLGAVQVKKGNAINWRYELIDGDRDADGRTTGDVGFRLQAVNVGTTVYLMYDSVRFIDATRAPLIGDVRYAVRTNATANRWTYFTLEPSSEAYPVAGYDVALSLRGKSVFASWLAASATEAPTPVADTLKIAELKTSGARLIRTVLSTGFGNPTAPLAMDANEVVYGCADRICSVNINDGSRNLISSATAPAAGTMTWLVPVAAGKKSPRGLVVSLNGALSLFRP